MEHITRKSTANLKVVVIAVAIAAFGTVFLLTGALLTSVYGLKPGDVGYVHHGGGVSGIPDNTPFQDFMVNGCLTAPWYENDKTVVLDTKGLEELGLLYYDPNYCFDIAKGISGYSIDKIEPYGEDQMKITLVKKP